MIKKIHRTLIIVCSIIYSITTIAADHHTKLQNIITQITQVKTDINQKEKQQISVEQQLLNLKAKIKVLGAHYQATIKNLKYQKSVLAKLNADQAKQQAKLREVQYKFIAQIVAAYHTEHSDYLKTVFYVNTMANSDQFLVYHRYIFKARLQQIGTIKNTLQQIDQNAQKIKKQTQILEKLESEQSEQKLELMQAQLEHNRILETLKDKIASQNKKLKDLLTAKRNLEKLIARLTAKMTRKRHAIVISPELKARLCQHFVWPTSGNISIHFGTPIEESSWGWNGIIISAPENQAIRAISSGTVVYAGWFNGYGLLLIIDHGSGYMSLYGHNKVLLKKVNDRVNAGEIIATLGRSDRDDPGLYFAIRYDGKPVDPELWCK